MVPASLVDAAQPTRQQLDPDFLPNIIKVWQSYDDLGSKADRDELSNEVMFGGKQVTLDEFAPNRAVVGSPDARRRASASWPSVGPWRTGMSMTAILRRPGAHGKFPPFRRG